MLSNGGIERRRSGGSSGFVSYSESFMRLMSTSNSSPRASCGAVWLRAKDDLKFYVMYMSTKEGDVKSFQYSTPVRGGSFLMPEELLKKHVALRTFIMTKSLAADIITKIEEEPHEVHGLSSGYRICPVACSEEIICANHARAFVSATLTAQDQRRQLNFYLFYNVNFIKFTLVQHPVGRHKDIFADGKPSLENRICFSFQKKGNDYGRGGAGMDNFCYALLDWSAPARNRRKAWTHPDNQHLPGSAADCYRQDPTITTVNDTRWDFFSQQENIVLPAGVNNIANLNY